VDGHSRMAGRPPPSQVHAEKVSGPFSAWKRYELFQAAPNREIRRVPPLSDEAGPPLFEPSPKARSDASDLSHVISVDRDPSCARRSTPIVTVPPRPLPTCSDPKAEARWLEYCQHEGIGLHSRGSRWRTGRLRDAAERKKGGPRRAGDRRRTRPSTPPSSPRCCPDAPHRLAPADPRPLDPRPPPKNTPCGPDRAQRVQFPTTQRRGLRKTQHPEGLPEE